jgi:hypothetical protein
MKLFFYFSIFLGVMGLLCFYSQVLWAKRAIRNNDKKYFNFIIKDSNGDISKGAEQWGVRCAIKLYSTKTKNYCTYWTPDEYKNLIKYYK